MDQFIANLPRGLFAIIVLAIALALIVFNDPPKTTCDSQMDIFKSSQSRFLFKASIKGVERKPLIEDLTESCRFHAGPGGCAELFERLRKLDFDLADLSSRCQDDAGSAAEIRGALLNSIDLIVRLAWGDKGPRSYALRMGWLDVSDFALFCRLKSRAIGFYGAEYFTSYRDGILRSLPGAENLPLPQALQRSLFDVSCEGYR